MFLIDTLDKLGNSKQKNFYTSKCNFFFTFYNNGYWNLFMWCAFVISF